MFLTKAIAKISNDEIKMLRVCRRNRRLAARNEPTKINALTSALIKFTQIDDSIAHTKLYDATLHNSAMLNYDLYIKDYPQFNISAPSLVNVDATNQIVATSSFAELPVLMRTNTPAICSVTNGNVTGLAPGTCTIIVEQLGNDDVHPKTENINIQIDNPHQTFIYDTPGVYSFTPTRLSTLKITVVGGGGGGAFWAGYVDGPPTRNGGPGQFIFEVDYTISSLTPIQIVVGAGGASGTGRWTPAHGTETFTQPSGGGYSKFGSIIENGGSSGCGGINVGYSALYGGTAGNGGGVNQAGAGGLVIVKT